MLRGNAQPARLAVEERLVVVLGLDVPHEAAVQVELPALAAEIGRRGGGSRGCLAQGEAGGSERSGI